MYANTQTQSLKAYDSVNKATQSGREIEAAVLTKAAVKLKECQDGWNAPDLDNRLEEALNTTSGSGVFFKVNCRVRITSCPKNYVLIFCDWRHLSIGEFSKPWHHRHRKNSRSSSISTIIWPPA